MRKGNRRRNSVVHEITIHSGERVGDGMEGGRVGGGICGRDYGNAEKRAYGCYLGRCERFCIIGLSRVGVCGFASL